MFLLEPAEAARRTRAALAYANIDVKESKKRIGISSPTMARIVSPTSPRGFRSIEEAWLIADRCEVPREFMEHGFAYDTANGSDARITKLEIRLGELETVIARAIAVRGDETGEDRESQ